MRALQSSAMLEHADWLRGLAHQLVRDGAEAEDVLQETLIAVSGLPLPEGVDERSWLAGVARNLLRNRRTRESRLKRREQDASRHEATGTSAMDDAALIERQRALLLNVESLPEDQRRVILMRFYEGLPPRKIAAAESLSVKVVHKRIERGLETLRGQLDSAYGDRRTWAAWAVPLGGVVPKAQGVAAAAAMAVVAAAIVAITVGSWHLLAAPDARTPERTTNESVVVALPDAGQAKTEAQSAGSELATVADVDAPERVAAPAPSEGGYQVQVLSSGVPAVGARVIAIPTKVFENDQAAFFRVEQTLWNQGVHVTTDKEGRCSIDLEPPFMVRASDELGLAYHGFDASTRSAIMELERAARLTVRVVNQHGEDLGMAESEGLEIVAMTRLKDVFSGPGDGDMLDQPTHRLIDGVAHFQNPWFGHDFGGLTAGTDNWQKSSIDAVALWIPGAPEFEPTAVSTALFRPFKKRVGEQERVLTMPPTGGLRIEVYGSDGELDSVNGSVSVTFENARVLGAQAQSYAAALTNGIAEYPAFVTGSRPFKATIDLPGEGANWTLDGTGPGRVGEVRTLKAFRPNRSAIQARLVDSLGQPLSKTSVMFSYAIEGVGNDDVDRQVRATSDLDGVVRFEVPPEENLAAPFAVTARASIFGGGREAIKLLDVAPDDILRGVSLGDLEMIWREPVVLKGRVTGEDGDPIAGTIVHVHRPGRHPYGSQTDDEGRFKLRVVLEPGSALVVDERGLGYLPRRVTLESVDGDDTLEVQLARGPRLVAQIDFSDFPALEEWTQLLLQDQAGDHVYVNRIDGGRFQSLPLEGGPYRCSLRLPFGSVPIAVVEGIEVPRTSSDFSDPRIDGLRLVDLIREIKLTHNGQPFASPPSVQVRAVGAPAEPGDSGSGLVYRGVNHGSGQMPCVVPLHLPFTLMVEGAGGANALFEDAQTLGDTIDVSFARKLRVRLNFMGTASAALFYELRGEAGTRAAGATARIMASRVTRDTRSVEVNFPMAGTYRLYQAQRPAPASGPDGALAMELPQPTTATIEVVDESPLSIRIDAPRK